MQKVSLLCLVGIVVSTLSAGCWMEHWYGHIGRDHSSDPYCHTGTVMGTYQGAVGIDFGKADPPFHYGTVLLLIRDNKIVGRVMVTGGSTGKPPQASFTLVRGSAQAGDKAVGIQNERKYEDLEP